MELIDKEIADCNLCGKLEKLKYNSLQIGKSRILVLGESPSKDGWIVSGRAFFNSDGKLQASGKILNKLLNICGINIEDVNFTECCKCIIEDRSRLESCAKNCLPILYDQIRTLPCDILVPMGLHPTQALLGIKIKRFSDYAGKEFQVVINKKHYKIIPIYHPSPINPKGYKDNIDIFKTLQIFLKYHE